jgi:hypothetical protein
MKNTIDSAAQRIFAKLAGTAMIIFATLFGIASIMNNSAKADNTSTINGTGKIMMSESGFLMNGKPVYHVLVWDSETGKSKIYGFNGINKMVAADYQLPSSPLY